MIGLNYDLPSKYKQIKTLNLKIELEITFKTSQIHSFVNSQCNSCST